MTNTADSASSDDSKSARAAPGGSPSSNPKKADSSATATQKSDIGFLQDSQPHSIRQYPEDTICVRYNGRGLPAVTPSMSSMRPALPSYQAHTVVLDRCVMPQRFFPTGPGHGVVYSSMHPLPLFPETTPNMNMPFNNPFPQAYPLYSQEWQQQQQQQQQHMPPQYTGSRYQPIDYSSPAHLEIPQAGYGETHYAPPTYAASHGQSAVQANVTIHLHSHRPSHNTQGNPAKASATLSKWSKSRSPESDYDVSKTIVDGSIPMRSTQARPSTMDAAPHPINLTRPITPRGPPRKPKQSGHALWVGNLPPGADINELKDYFARDATHDVESVFLISKSNCAFVNYKTEVTCLAALSRFHDTRFHGARLVCRLRRDSMSPPQPDSSSFSSQAENGTDAIHNEQNGNMLVKKIADSTYSSPRMPNRYFIVKSLSIDDLELSRQSGIWATQAHNEDNLNQAYQTTDNVYLVFSANKSGEYYGYARMVSPIQEDDSLIMEVLPRPSHVQAESEDLDLIPTPATSTAPNGRIINDLARGTVFWEADSSEDEGGSKIDKNIADVAEEVAESGFQSIGKPFRIQWLSTERVPFYRTRGLRNPWNANREIKIARDGTEIEPTVGERLVQLFHTPYPG
ncbi:YT521-B-like domain-containing protein [Aspergillus pseudotamarii]|uniref:YT521-B-like domain-containing protein n=1 Tax=Aspergillus pseudotamarii TaxID=132259 RepID=A0A5N6SGY2_ASPPS|nr:YT521-B-like domain-containing protein [Aspergillus pseudotamarii]KAE8133139.1 YT521-B-like domain-containing protein [Aspergillus pseudotamarii]